MLPDDGTDPLDKVSITPGDTGHAAGGKTIKGFITAYSSLDAEQRG
jgi:hypothetical protein